MESALGEGSTFHIELPRLRSQELDGATTGLVIEPGPESNGTKILVDDDEMTLRTVLARRLTPHGYHVDVAADGDQAWRMLNQNRYGCILLDLRMPGLACQDLYRRIVDLDLELAERILFITGGTVNPETKKFMDTVPNLLVAKPFEFSEVERLVRSLVERGSQQATVNRGDSNREPRRHCPEYRYPLSLIMLA